MHSRIQLSSCHETEAFATEPFPTVGVATPHFIMLRPQRDSGHPALAANGRQGALVRLRARRAARSGRALPPRAGSKAQRVGAANGQLHRAATCDLKRTTLTPTVEHAEVHRVERQLHGLEAAKHSWRPIPARATSTFRQGLHCTTLSSSLNAASRRHMAVRVPPRRKQRHGKKLPAPWNTTGSLWMLREPRERTWQG